MSSTLVDFKLYSGLDDSFQLNREKMVRYELKAQQ
jgi:hypothetical protein